MCLVAACGGCAHAPPPASVENLSHSLLECLEPPTALFNDTSPKIQCHEADGAACCAYDLVGTQCVILICASNCAGWAPPLLRCLDPEDNTSETSFELGLFKPEEFEL